MERLITRARIRRAAAVAAAAAIASCGAAGAAQADAPASDPRVDNIKAVVVLIGANDYGFADVDPSRNPR
jgi:hypothetical protein